MSSIKSHNTKPELILRKSLRGYKYQPKIFGKPDFINYKKRIVLFVDGCFWHQCPIHSKRPKHNKEYWLPKLKRNVIRAKEVDITYKNSGWEVRRLWEHTLINLEKCPNKIKKFV